MIALSINILSAIQFVDEHTIALKHPTLLLGAKPKSSKWQGFTPVMETFPLFPKSVKCWSFLLPQ